MTWTATERELHTLEQGLAGDAPILLTEIRDDQTNLICQLQAPADDPEAIEEMRARARLIVKAPRTLKALQWLYAICLQEQLLPPTVSYMKEAEEVIAATEYDTVDRADIGHEEGEEHGRKG